MEGKEEPPFLIAPEDLRVFEDGTMSVALSLYPVNL